ncbi:aminotransferase class I/II-fold pyridoxal phosphate-dependent enzyme [Amnibacterium setariae]|uniref:Aminotransferase class I/II-fold pyridoxal phosphate-dependent enzyme n=1 Tax=Amnibacterium setariae TaxID=2306585 RepID=A0A3A1U294_9MICO|nr:aminotransferase class I/II-fold pyridoxal phosphate-dependent enzyme [Amnibacterium setariae]RIX30964.1 aminotransferase class I/II-fold pyridoxal phosphate-dependent enzyme [Amnibacterium setariae]
MWRTGPWRRAAAGAGLLTDDGVPGTTIFAEMSALANATGAINLGQGFPDTDGPREVLLAAQEAIAAGLNQYPPGRGTAVLREAIARHQRRWYGLEVDPDTEVLVTAGATEALAAVLLAFVDEGEEVLTLEPAYDAYGAIIALAGGVHRTVPVDWPAFRPDADRLRDAITDRTRVILLNTPHNPTGAVLDEALLRVVVEAAERHDALIVTDEVYEHLVLDGARHVPVATLPGARDRTITISSGGKTFSTTGWKIGWLTGPAELVSSALAVKQFLTYVNGAPFQPAIAVGLDLPDAVFAGIAADLQAGRDLLLGGLEAAGLPVSSPAAGYFVIADGAALGFPDGADLCRRLPELAGVVGVPVSAFCRGEQAERMRSLVRFAYCKSPAVLQEASTRLATLRPR